MMEVTKNTKRKYHNRPTEIDGITFDSRKEGMRYAELKQMEKAGLISGLEFQKPFELIPKFKLDGKTYRQVTYIADFAYYDETPDGSIARSTTRWVVEDVKSTITRKNPVYRLKKKMMAYFHHIEVKEI